MMINLFMPLILIMTLQYFIFFSKGDISGNIGRSSKLLLTTLSYLRVFRASIPVNPRFSLADSYALSVLLIILWTIIDAFAFPVKKGMSYSSSTEIARYTLIGIVSLYPGWVILRTMKLYWEYKQFVKRAPAETLIKLKNPATQMMIDEWATQIVPKENLAKFLATKIENKVVL